MMNYDALMIVDMQTALVEAEPYNRVAVIENIKALLDTSRKKGLPVIYIQHDGGTGDELEHGSIGWTIYKDIAPMPDEKIFEKQYNSAFRKTGLHEYLQEIGVKTLFYVECRQSTVWMLPVRLRLNTNMR